MLTGLAQLVEHWSPKPGVGSSSLSTRAKNKNEMSVIKYVKDSFEELKNHVTWVSKEDAQKTTLTVVVFTVLFALTIAGVDYVFQDALDNLFKFF